MRIAITSIIVQAFQPRYANRNFGEAFPPRPPETISDDNGDVEFQAFFQFAMELGRGAVWVLGKQECMTATIDVRSIDSAIGADQALSGFGDQDAALAPHHPLALRQSQFSNASVEIVTPCPRARTCGGLDAIKLNQPAFRFGYDLVLHDQDVAFSQRFIQMLQGVDKFFRQ